MRIADSESLMLIVSVACWMASREDSLAWTCFSSRAILSRLPTSKNLNAVLPGCVDRALDDGLWGMITAHGINSDIHDGV